MKEIINYLFPKLTSEQKVNRRTQEIFAVLNSQTEYDISDLEKVLVVNNLRLELNEHLMNKKNQLMSDSVDSNLRAEEVLNAMKHINQN